MLTKDLLRVSRRGGGFQPTFAGPDDRELAARTIGVFQGHVGEERADLRAALTDLERAADEFKLARGFAGLLEREGVFETVAAVEPERAREAAFEAAEAVGVVTAAERETAIERAAGTLGVEPGELDCALHADRESRQVLAAFEPRWDPDGLLAQYNLSLAQTALFDATEMRVRSADPRAVVSAVKWLGLMYEIHRTDDGTREVVLTGPDALFRSTRRYGNRFARLLRSVAKTAEWRVEATIDDRGTERNLVLTDDDPVRVPDAEPLVEPSYDSDVEREFATRFSALDLDWNLVREPEPLAAGARVMIPDFAFEYRPASVASRGSSAESGGGSADFRVFFEVMGFWTPEYVEKKLGQLETVEDVDMVVAVDESLGVGEEIAARDHRVVTYSGSVRLKDVRDVLREYEAELVAESVEALPEELVPEADVIGLEALAAEYGVSESAVEGKAYPEHERVGRSLVRPDVLEAVAECIEAGMALSEVEEILGEFGLGDSSAVLSRLGYRVEWEGLSGGTVRRRNEG